MIYNWIPFIAILLTILVNYAVPLIRNTNIGNINKNRELEISPAGYAFSIWGIIYIGLILFTLLNPCWSYVTILFFVMSCVFNSAWIITWTKQPPSVSNIYIGNIFLILIVISLLLLWSSNLTSKISSNKFIGNCKGDKNANIIFQNIIAIYLAWTIGASLLNTGISLKSILNDKIINYLVIGGLCIFHVGWQLFGKYISTQSSFLKDSIAVPLVGLWTSIAIYNNGNIKTKKLGLMSTILTSLCLFFNLYNM